MNSAVLESAIINRWFQSTFQKDKDWVDEAWRTIIIAIEKHKANKFHWESTHCIHLNGGPTISYDKFANTITIRDGHDVFEYQRSRDHELNERIADILAFD